MTVYHTTQLQEAFATTLCSFVPLEEDILAFIRQRIQIRIIPKNTLLLPLGAVCDSLYFVAQGLLRGYYQEDDHEISSWFVKEGDFIYSPYSFLEQKPTLEAVQVLEDAVLVGISYKDVQDIYDTFPITNKIRALITEHYLLQYDERVRSLRTLTAEQRLRRFIKYYPELYERVPHKYLASFLGIAPETLSRVLKRKN